MQEQIEGQQKKNTIEEREKEKGPQIYSTHK